MTTFEQRPGEPGEFDEAAPALERIAALVALSVAQQRELDAAVAAAELAKENLSRTLNEDLPLLMQELTLSEVKLTDGTSVSLKQEVDCAITEANRESAHRWMRDKGFGGLIKTDVTVSFGVGEEELMERIVEELTESLQDEQRIPEVVERVHPATLKAFVKERLAAAQQEPESVPPTGLFSIFPYEKAKVTPPKPKKQGTARRPGTPGEQSPTQGN